jgi:hypothetical protein
MNHWPIPQISAGIMNIIVTIFYWILAEITPPRNEYKSTKNKPVGIESNEVPSIVIRLASPVNGNTVTQRINQAMHMQI